jgi:hypothetical protein
MHYFLRRFGIPRAIRERQRELTGVCRGLSGNNRQQPALTGVSRSTILWAVFDFANSGCTTATIAAVFSTYVVVSPARRALWKRCVR